MIAVIIVLAVEIEPLSVIYVFCFLVHKKEFVYSFSFSCFSHHTYTTGTGEIKESFIENHLNIDPEVDYMFTSFEVSHGGNYTSTYNN